MENNSFLQSQSWEKFQQSAGCATFRVDGALLIKKPLLLGKSYFYAPRTDLSRKTEDIRIFLNKIEKLAKKEKSIFLRVEPVAELKIENCKLKIARSADVQPSQTIILDLTKSEDELLAQMHPKTRYNIRLAEKKGIKVFQSDDFEKFWELMKETTGRDGFRAHNKDYYQKMLQPHPIPPLIRGGNEREGLKLYFAQHENKILAAGIFVFYQNTVTYLHGASTHEHKEVMAPYALHWQMIKLAKKLGYAKYDFYGIDEKKWPGVTRFKRGFGGGEINYQGCFDIVFNNKWYEIYKLVKWLKKLM